MGVDGPHPARDGRMVYDSTRRRVLYFGGANPGQTNELWEWRGSRWTLLEPGGPLPPPTSGPTLAYDPKRDRLVLVTLNSTWEFDGTDWNDVTSEGERPNASGHRAVYDPFRERVVLFGGVDVLGGQTILDELWEWDGQTWTERALASPTPEPRYRHSLSFDLARRELVLFGGFDGGGRDDTWILSDDRWRRFAPEIAPANTGASAYDAHRARIVVFSQPAGGRPAGLWEWDGSSWTERLTGSAIDGVVTPLMAYHAGRQRTVLITTVGPMRQFEWDGESLEEVPVSEGPPEAGRTLAYDGKRETLVMLVPDIAGLLSDTWLWDGQWRRVAEDVSIASDSRLVYDPVAEAILSFGGNLLSNGPVPDETWRWDGAVWTELMPPGNVPVAGVHTFVF
ncbi:MAG: hypothetical protein AAFY60_16200, partial [Myxococcota bacterium]